MANTNYAETIRDLTGKMRKSPTAMAVGASPTDADKALQRRIMATEKVAESQRSDELRKRWYPDRPETEGGGPKRGALENILAALNVPTAIGSATLRTALGQGSGLGQNIKESIEGMGSYGDVFRGAGISNLVSAPLGFVMDVALDPVNWLTAGTEALIPRVGFGLAKAGGAGAKAGAESWAKKTMSSVLQRTSKTYSDMLWELPKASADSPSFYRRLADGTKKSEDMYRDLTGAIGADGIAKKSAEYDLAFDRAVRGAGEAVDRTGWTKHLEDWFGTIGMASKHMERAMEAEKAGLKSAEEAYKATGGRQIDPYLKRVTSRTRRIFGVGKPGSEPESDFYGRYIESRKTGQSVLDGKVPSKASDTRNVVERAANTAVDVDVENEFITRQLDEVAERYLNPEGVAKLGAKSAKERRKYLANFSTYKSGVDSYDRKVAETLLNSGALNTFDAYAKAINIFKVGVIGVNPASYVNGIVGNMAFTSMAGISVMNRGWWDSLKKARRFLVDGDLTQLRKEFGDKAWLEMARGNPDTFRRIYGFDPEMIDLTRAGLRRKWSEVTARVADGKPMSEDYWKAGEELTAKLEEAALKVAKSHGVSSPEELQAIYDREIKNSLKAMSKPFSTGADDTLVTAIEGGGVTANMAQEIVNGVGQEMLKTLKAAESLPGAKGKLAKAFRLYLEVPMDNYGKIDTVFKLATSLHLTNNGITAAEFRNLSKRIKLDPSEYVRSPSGDSYKLTPMGAMKVANDIYLNYLAMPAFVKVMRSLPVVGSPFLSFSYGMGESFIRAMGYNPAFFNRMSFLVHEASGEKTPLEKSALEGKYYSYLDKPSVVKLPFFTENPLYLNLANMVPHYTMQMLEAPGRTYKTRFGTEVAAAIDRSGAFSDPIGQLMLNYVVLPSMLGEAIGKFGQNIYPSDAGIAEKAGLMATGLVEPFIPKMAGYAAALSPVPVPEGAMQYVPSQAFRSLRNAIQGKSQVGIKGTEPASSRTLREAGKVIGLPITPVNLKYQ